MQTVIEESQLTNITTVMQSLDKLDKYVEEVLNRSRLVKDYRSGELDILKS